MLIYTVSVSWKFRARLFESKLLDLSDLDRKQHINSPLKARRLMRLSLGDVLLTTANYHLHDIDVHNNNYNYYKHVG